MALQLLPAGLHAFGGDNEATPVKDMSSEQACAVLQVRKEASFDEVLRAKKRLSANFQGDEQKVREVWFAPCCHFMACSVLKWSCLL